MIIQALLPDNQLQGNRVMSWKQLMASIWTNIALGNAGQIFNKVVFVNNKTGYIVGNGGKIFTTTDTGDSWSEMTSGTANVLRNFDYSNNVRIAVGDGGVIMRLVDTSTSNQQLADNKQLELYPNPVKDILNITTNADVKSFTIRDLTGKRCWFTMHNQLSIWRIFPKEFTFYRFKLLRDLLKRKLWKIDFNR